MKWVIGIDEVGRGPLAGPVHVCAVAMPLREYKKMKWQLDDVPLADSKVMRPLARVRWHDNARILEKEGKIRIAISYRSASLIDQLGISSCIRSCIRKALRQLALDPLQCLVLLDGGLRAPREYTFQQTIVRGDDTQKIISLAAVIAKVTRDRLMQQLHKKVSYYAWDENKGYGTLAHRRAIELHGPSLFHRKSFLKRIEGGY